MEWNLMTTTDFVLLCFKLDYNKALIIILNYLSVSIFTARVSKCFNTRIAKGNVMSNWGRTKFLDQIKARKNIFQELFFFGNKLKTIISRNFIWKRLAEKDGKWPLFATSGLLQLQMFYSVFANY